MQSQSYEFIIRDDSLLVKPLGMSFIFVQCPHSTSSDCPEILMAKKYDFNLLQNRHFASDFNNNLKEK